MLLAELSAPQRLLVIDGADAVAEGMLEQLRYLVDAARTADVGVIAITAADNKQVLHDTVAEFLEANRRCPGCGRRLGLKGHRTITFRTLFGNVALDSPRLRRCRCASGDPATFSPLTELLTEHTSPELLYMETK